MSYIYDYAHAGFRVFAIWGISPKDGSCECGDPDCDQPGKHPRVSGWTSIPHWSDEQLDNMAEFLVTTGFGVVVDGCLVIDIDPRNGGNESYEKLVKKYGIDFKSDNTLVVETGGGGWHIYYRLPDDAASYCSSLSEYPGIDFKTSGYVVGATSLHASGCAYEVAKGHPDDLADAPDPLVGDLIKKDHHRVDYKGEAQDVSDEHLRELVSYIDPDCDYETWSSIGMALHQCTSGAGFDIWDEFSAKGGKYPGRRQVDRHWHSFGKCDNPVKYGTLLKISENYGYTPSVTFDAPAVTEDCGDHPFPVSQVDLLRPPGFVGTIASWIDSQCRFSRENLSVAAALVAMGNVAGLRHRDDRDGVSLNLFAFARAGSATGKEAVQQAMADVHRAAGISAATHGSIKSEQEIIRNLTRHQAAFYIVDEVGILLKKITNAQQRGGAAYLEGTIGALMSAYSKATGFMLLTGDAKEEVRRTLAAELSQCRNAVAENEDDSGVLATRIPQIERALGNLDNGLERPFVSLMGYTTPVTFDEVVNYEQSTNGFIGRALLVTEPETNPRARKGFRKAPMADSMKATLQHLYSSSFDMMGGARVEFYGDQKVIQTDEDADLMLDQVADWFHGYAEQHKESTGLEAVVRRAYELVAKVSCILAAPSGLRTAEHVRWAYALARRDVDEKINLAYGNMMEDRKDQSSQGQALKSRIMGMVSEDEGETLGVLANRCSRKWSKEDIHKAIESLVDGGHLVKHEYYNEGNRKTVVKFYKGK